MQNSGRKSGIVYKVIILILLVVIGFSLYKICTIGYGYWKGQQTYKAIAADFSREKDNEKKIDWEKIQKKYPDAIAWLCSEGTIIDYPVARGRDNDWYLHHMLTGEWNGAGALFVDKDNKEPFRDFLTIIYGHHMRDGSMFGSLVKYRDPEYYKRHKKLKLYTPDQDYCIEIIGSCTIPGDSERYRFDFAGDEEKREYLDWIDRNTETATEEHADVKDHIVMLSTCTYEFNDARFAVFGKLVKR